MLLTLSFSIIFIGINCRNSYKTEFKQQERVIVIAEVEDVTPLRIIRSTKLWQVQIRIDEIISNPHANIQVNDKAYLYIHSIIRTFLVDVNNIKGKVFKITYLQDYNINYDGDLNVVKKQCSGQL